MIQPGSSLGRYEIVSALGKGGMGEVWRARDTRLGREVAIKTLPPEFAEDTDRLTRFEREARLLASLNHPNIAAIYGVEEHQGSQCLVLELVEGETLGDRIRQGPIPVDEALRLAMQIADALKAAHETGVIHRDLKPDNVKVSEAGTVKVLDFGLAKAVEGSAQPDAANSPTLSMAATEAGVILGTAGYMSPEQAKGRRADRRTDIWALGCVLFEMLTGKPTFAGDDVTEILADVVRGEPNWDLLPSDLPSNIAACLKLCLARAPGERVQDVGDVRLALGGAFAGSTASLSAPRFSRERAFWIAAVVVLLGIVVVGISRRPPASPPLPPTRTVIAQVDSVASRVDGFALSPVSRQLAYAAGDADRGLWTQDLDQEIPRRLEGTDGALYPFWSADGRAIGFFANGSLNRITLGSGAVQRIAPVSSRPQGGTWNSDGVVLFSDGDTIFRVPASGGQPVPLHTPDASGDAVSFRWPSFLPDGRRYLYSVTAENGSVRIQAGELDTAGPDRVLQESLAIVSRAEYVEPGVLVYVDASVFLVGQRVDPQTLDPSGGPVAFSPGQIEAPAGWSSFSVRPDILTYKSLLVNEKADKPLIWRNREGEIVDVVAEELFTWRVEISGDGTRIAATQSRPDGEDIWMYTEGVQNPERLTEHPNVDYGAVWSPDNREIAFTSLRNGREEALVKTLDGEAEVLVSERGVEYTVEDWSDDGKSLIVRRTEGASADLWIHSFDGDDFKELLATPYDEYQAQFSPGSRLVAYTTNRAGPGQAEVYVASMPDMRNAVPVGFGTQPRWRGDGQELELYYIAPDGTLTAHTGAVSADGRWVPSEPVSLFPLDAVGSGSVLRHHTYDVSPDGQRFLFLGPDRPGLISVFQNWAAELADR